MRKFVLSIATAASLAACALAAPVAEAAPILSQTATAVSALHALPTDQVRYRRQYVAPRRGPRVVYRTVYRTRYVYARPHARRRPVVRYYQPSNAYDVTSEYGGPLYAQTPVYVAPQVYPQTYYDTPAYVAPVYGGPAYVAPVVTPRWGGGGFAHHGGGGGGWGGGGGGGGHHRHH
jgi:hypothetical protein